MAGRLPTLNWTTSRKQFTVTLDGKFYLLGSDKDAADQHFRFLLNKHDLAEAVTSKPTFLEIADQWLEYVEKNHDARRYRLCKARLQEFVEFVGSSLRVQQLRTSHVERWLAQRILKPGTIRLYKATILAVLDWAASQKIRLIPHNPIRGLLELPGGG